MSLATRFVDSLGSLAGGPPLQAVMATPGFPSSRNVVFLLGPEQSSEPTLVAKVARLGGGDEGLAREAGNLRLLERGWPHGEAVPRLVAHGSCLGHEILLETAVSGRPMSPRVVRQQPTHCIDAVMTWLIRHHTADNTGSVSVPFDTLGLEPLADLEPMAAPGSQLARGAEVVRQRVRRLQDERIPVVFEHGDLGSPNLLLRRDGSAGILDWELAIPHGLPAVDIFFFLAFVAASLSSARGPRSWIDSFDDAFFGNSAWARPYVLRYASAVGLPARTLAPLFLLCWTRYLAGVPRRQAWAVDGFDRSLGIQRMTEDRAWHLWLHAVEHIDEFGCRP